MIEVSDAQLPEDAEQIHQALPTEPVGVDNDVESLKCNLSQKLANYGIDLRHFNLPRVEDQDDYDLWRFLTIDPRGACELDIKNRVNAGLRVLNRTCLNKLPPAVADWGVDVRKLLEHAQQEGTKRLPSHSQRGGDLPFRLTYQEFPETFQSFLLYKFSPSLAIINASEVRYTPTVASPSGTIMLKPSQALSFYESLFDFSTESKPSLKELVRNAIGRDPRGTSVLLALTRFPAEFPQWFLEQLVALRSENAKMSFVVLVLWDALPCAWKEMEVLCDSPMQNRIFDGFRGGDVFLNPATLAFVEAGVSPAKLLKKAKCLSFQTDICDGRGSSDQVPWRQSLLPSLEVSHRLVFDFQQEAPQKFTACCKVWLTCSVLRYPHLVIAVLVEASWLKDQPATSFLQSAMSGLMR